MFVSAPSNNATSYQWTLPVGMIILGASDDDTLLVVINSTFTGGQILVAGVNVCGTSATRGIQVNSGNPPAAPGPISGPAGGLCTAKTVNYSVTAVPGLVYNWAVSTGITIVSGQGTPTIEVDFVQQMSQVADGVCMLSIQVGLGF
jgi:hypothetical protein